MVAVLSHPLAENGTVKRHTTGTFKRIRANLKLLQSFTVLIVTEGLMVQQTLPIFTGLDGCVGRKMTEEITSARSLHA